VATLSVALAHYRRRARMARALERQAVELWRQVERANIARSWSTLMSQLLVTLSAAQAAEALAADAYVAAALAAQGNPAVPVATLNSQGFAGVASDGRTLDSLLMQPVVTTKVGLAQGWALPQAMAYGQAALQMIVSTQLADAGRIADQVSMVSHHSQGYVRMVVGRTCSRCVVLAGRWYRWNASFQRHPRCDCTGIPAAEDAAGDLRTDPAAYFRSLSHAEQDKLFTQAGAQAIRDGADMSQVVNVRRKNALYAAGGQRLTREGVTRRSLYGGYYIDDAGNLRKRPRGVKAPPRLTPEEIYRQSGGDRDEALGLLRRYAYLI
jgi:hypothetical protein